MTYQRSFAYRPYRAGYHQTVALTPGQRITLAKAIGESLKHEDIPDLELTLNTFGVPTADLPAGNWLDAKYEYVLRRLVNAPDAVVAGVYSFLYPDAEEVEVGELEQRPAGPWSDGSFKLFLSHTHPNRVLAGQLRTRLIDYGVDTFVAHDMIEPTKQWQEEIEAALMTCDALAALLTEDFIGSRWCDQEVGTILGRGLCIVGVKQDADPHGFIGKYQAVNGDTSPYSAWVIAERIVGALWVNAKTRPLMARPAAVAYEQSTSFDNARANYSRLRELGADEWTDEMVEMVEAAGRENRQLEEGVSLEPDEHGKLLPELLSRHLDDLLNRKTSVATLDAGSDFQNRFQVQLSDATAGSEDDIPF